MDIGIALIVDICLLIGSLWLILQVSKLSIFNPSLWWVALHAYCVTFRLITLNLGVQSVSLIGIQSDTELVNAAIASDISLLAVVGATLFIAYKSPENKASKSIESRWSQLNPRVGQVISMLCLTIGTYALIAFSAVATAAQARGTNVSAMDIGRWDESAYPGLIGGFAVQGALIQCAVHGFTRWRVILLMLMLALISINPARTGFVTAAIMAFMIYQTMRKRHSVTMKWAVCVVLLGLLWFVYKPISQGIVAGYNAEAIWSRTQNYFQDSVGASPSIDTQFLDMQATNMAAADEAGVRFYGTMDLPLVFLPIPRFMWPDKPSMAEYAQKITSSSRPIAITGMTPNLSGQGYMEFGWVGCAIIPFLYIYGMQTAFRRVSSLGITSVARWIYLIFLATMLQVFRDGLSSVFVFPFMAYLPLLGWGAISKLLSANHAGVKYLQPHYVLPVARRRVE
jgi:hypothetical protein